MWLEQFDLRRKQPQSTYLQEASYFFPASTFAAPVASAPSASSPPQEAYLVGLYSALFLFSSYFEATKERTTTHHHRCCRRL